MLDSKQREAELLRARERLARAYARLEATIGVLPERIRQLESSREKAESRITEIEELLGRERAINAQSRSLSEGASEELHVLNARLEKAEKLLAERDKKYADLEKTFDQKNSELITNEKAHVESLEREEVLLTTIARLEEENAAIERRLELMKEERENLQRQLSLIEEKDNSFALMFTQDERLGLLKTVDALIERVDGLVGHQTEIKR